LMQQRRGYAILDRYKERAKAAAQEGKEGESVNKKEEEKPPKKRRRGSIPLQHLGTIPPEVVETRSFDGEAEQGKVLHASFLGAPNAGKSTLTNALLGTKVSAVSPKAQTTRGEVLGIMYDDDTNTQVVLSDTPGVVPMQLQKKYGREIALTGWEGIEKADAVIVVIDAARKVDQFTLHIIDRLAKEKPNLKSKHLLLVMNKMDLVFPRTLALRKLEEYNRDNLFNETFFISSLKQNGIAKLRSYLISKAVAGQLPYPKEWKSDLSLFERTEEIIREKIYCRINGDVPYRVWLENLAWYVGRDGGYVIHHNILVPNTHLKKIMVGEDARTIKCISMGVQKELEKLFHRNVHLFLAVKVQTKHT